MLSAPAKGISREPRSRDFSRASLNGGMTKLLFSLQELKPRVGKRLTKCSAHRFSNAAPAPLKSYCLARLTIYHTWLHINTHVINLLNYGLAGAGLGTGLGPECVLILIIIYSLRDENLCGSVYTMYLFTGHCE